MLLYKILEAHGGNLPKDIAVIFANTGREMPATLDFVRDMGAAWSVGIEWVEFQHGYDVGGARGRRWRWAEAVDYNSASRNGEPFDRMLESKKIVPDRARRFCTTELKVLTIERHVRASRHWRRWQNVVGFRVDEGGRIDKKRNLEAHSPGRFWSTFPLDVAGIDELDVAKFWAGQPFDLQLDADGDGGNCDGCFMFSSARIGRMFQKYPARMEWWPKVEQAYGTKTMRPKQSYASIRDAALAGLPHDDSSPCDEVCGV